MVLHKLNELKTRANCAIMCAMADARIAKPQSKAAVRAKKVIGVADACAVATTLCTVTAFAAGETEFFKSALGVLQTVLILIGAGIAIWGVVNLLEGYSNDNPGANAHVR